MHNLSHSPPSSPQRQASLEHAASDIFRRLALSTDRLTWPYFQKNQVQKTKATQEQ